MKTLCLSILLAVATGCEIPAKSNTPIEQRAVSLARAAVTIPGFHCVLAEVEGAERKVFAQRLSRADGTTALSLREAFASEEVPSSIGVRVADLSLERTIQLRPYTPDSQDEHPYSLGGNDGEAELRVTEDLTGAIYRREVEVSEDETENVLYTKLADLKDCAAGSAVVRQD